jgi:transcription termination factor Rho
MEVHLDRKFAEKRIYPALDIAKSGTRKEELLFDKETFKQITTLRRWLGMMTPEEQLGVMIEKLSKYKTNKEFLESMNNAGR